MTRRTLMLSACGVVIGMIGSSGCENGGLFVYSPFGILIAQNPPDHLQTEPAEEPDPLPVPDDTAVRIWEELDGTSTLSICRWDSQHGRFDCDPSIDELLAQSGLHLESLEFQVDSLGGIHAASMPEPINVGVLPEAVCASATASVTDADGRWFQMTWPRNCR